MVPPVPIPETKMSTLPSVSARISGPVVVRWISALAWFSNWRTRTAPSAASSSAFATAPFMPSALSVRTSSAPNARSSARRSFDIDSGMVSLTRYPREVPIIARAMPVLPEVASTIVPPGLSSPDFSAASIIATPMRSLTEFAGLYDSSLAMTSAPERSLALLTRISGVRPTRSETLLKMVKVSPFTLLCASAVTGLSPIGRAAPTAAEGQLSSRGPRRLVLIITTPSPTVFPDRLLNNLCSLEAKNCDVLCHSAVFIALTDLKEWSRPARPLSNQAPSPPDSAPEDGGPPRAGESAQATRRSVLRLGPDRLRHRYDCPHGYSSHRRLRRARTASTCGEDHRIRRRSRRIGRGHARDPHRQQRRRPGRPADRRRQ